LFKDNLPKFENSVQPTENVPVERLMPSAGLHNMEEAQTATCSDNLAFSARARKQAVTKQAAEG
jgi:hypothetical protein